MRILLDLKSRPYLPIGLVNRKENAISDAIHYISAHPEAK